MQLLSGKVAIVTGAARGIGKAIALCFAEAGAIVAFSDRAESEMFFQTEAELKKFTPESAGFVSDATDYKSTEEFVEKVAERYGRIDILVNNAGITRDNLLLRMSEADWDAVIGVNLKSAFNLTKTVQKHMIKQRSGSIINITSVVGVHGNAGQANYAASKAGMIGLTKSMAQELGPRNIRSNAVAPGFIVTEMTAKLSDEVRAEWAKKIPLRREGYPNDVAQVCLFLASDMSSYINGQVLQVDGGMNT